ncbi:MAG: FmdE family protein [Pseudomonadota bacterium]
MLKLAYPDLEPTFQELLGKSVAAHGHLCPGQVLGVRMGMLGLAMLGYSAPLGPKSIKKVLVFVEIDRCAADALASATGVKLGRRSLKFKDYGLMAATFYHLPDSRAIRIAVREDCREKAVLAAPHILEPHAREVEVYQALSASELFTAEEVVVNLAPEDLPGFSLDKTTCQDCGAVIRHRRFVEKDGRRLCKVCAGEAYFQRSRPITDLDALDPVITSHRGT